MSDKTRRAVERFPDLAGVIKQHCADNRFFCSLCEDYGEAVDMLRRWEGEDSPPTPESINACRDLITDLEQEILIELQNRIDGL